MGAEASATFLSSCLIISQSAGHGPKFPSGASHFIHYVQYVKATPPPAGRLAREVLSEHRRGKPATAWGPGRAEDKPEGMPE